MPNGGRGGALGLQQTAIVLQGRLMNFRALKMGFWVLNLRTGQPSMRPILGRTVIHNVTADQG